MKDLQNYHLLYGLEKVCTGDWGVQTQRNAFFKEARFTNSAAAAALSEDAACGGAVYKSPQLVGVVGAFTQDAYEGLVANNVATNIPLTLTFHSSIFGSGSDKYFPLSAMNGFRLVLTLNSPNNAFQVDVGSQTTYAIRYQVNNPTLYTNMIRVDPAVDRGIIDASKGTDGRIRIHTQSWRTYQVTVVASDTTKNVVVPVSLSSLKALYFTHTNPTPVAFNSASAFYKRFLNQYQLFVGSVAIPTSPVLVSGTFVEPIAELLRAWHVRLNDQDFSTLLDPDYYLDEYSLSLTPATNYRSSAVFGVELESFSLKDDVIESGANVLNNNVELRLTYSQASAQNVPYNLMFFALYDCFLVIDPETGITTVEF